MFVNLTCVMQAVLLSVHMCDGFRHTLQHDELMAGLNNLHRHWCAYSFRANPLSVHNLDHRDDHEDADLARDVQALVAMAAAAVGNRQSTAAE